MNAKKLRIFGFILFGFLVVSGIILKNNTLFFIAIFNLIISIFYPLFYFKYKIYQLFQILGKYIGKINSFLIIMFLFYFIITPMSIFLKLLQIDLLDKKINKKNLSYFRNRDVPPNSLTKQF